MTSISRSMEPRGALKSTEFTVSLKAEGSERRPRIVARYGRPLMSSVPAPDHWRVPFQTRVGRPPDP